MASASRPTVLIVGGTGFVGAHLKAHMDASYRVFAVGQDHDVRKPEAMMSLVADSMPGFVVNLASITTVRESFDDPARCYQIGFLGTLHLLQALEAHQFCGTFLNVSSSEVYGHPSAEELPLREESSMRPMSPYAVCKVAAESLCFQWSQSAPFSLVTARPFTHIGPGQSTRFAISNFAKQLSEIRAGRRSSDIGVGDLDTTRDFTDVRDIVRAYELLLHSGRNGESYNVCSGRETRMRDALDQLIAEAGVSVTTRMDPSLARTQQQQRMLGDYTKLHRDTGWRPLIPMRETLRDTIAHWADTLR